MKKYFILSLLVTILQTNAWAQMLSNTKVILSGNFSVPMGHLLPGDEILASDQTFKRVNGVYHEANEQAMFYITTEGGNTLVCDKDQVLQLSNRKLIQAKKVKAGHVLHGQNGPLQVVSISFVFVSTDVSLLSFGPTVEDVNDHLYFANGISVGGYSLTRGWMGLPAEVKE
ncbi:Hint domain-containing protein [Peredibacter starrii]|uniref:Hint domain-containing protein n=1 Tax=Peredibacter starrii TaxID=28202 RepID=A0AAX4HTI3_9BACT|nr:Hint domain-containing protein [Peredibacter starrii]WPU66234.1 Hint domain-containing protein [Peredibacter starrii]